MAAQVVVLFSGLGCWTGEREVCSTCARCCAYFCFNQMKEIMQCQ